MKPANFKSPFDWNNRHITIHDKIWYLPKQFFDFDSFQFPGWSDRQVFEKQQPICIEYCSGNGAWIAERALKYPHLNWLAVEKKFVRVRKIWSKLKSLHLTNLLIACAEGSLITEKYFPSGSVKSVYINFPDPWPKTRHAKHRIIQKSFIEDIWRILEENGELTVVTDDPDYSEIIHKVLQQCPGFQSLYQHPYYTEDYPDYGTSYFEDLWREKGKTIRYHVYRKVNPEDVEEDKYSEFKCLDFPSPKIYNGNWQEKFLSNFDAITIILDGELNSRLEWEKEKQQAKAIIEAGHVIFWKLNLGLEKKLFFPFHHQTQFLSLSLAFQHFKEFLWEEFKDHSIGLSFYQGDANFKSLFHWDDDQIECFKKWLDDRHFENYSVNDLLQDESSFLVSLHCRDIVIEYFNLLINQLPEELKVYLLLDFNFLKKSIYKQLSFLNHEGLHRFSLALKNTHFRNIHMGWDHPSPLGYIGNLEGMLPVKRECQIGVSLPPANFCCENDYSEIVEGVSHFVKHEIPFKLILENQLTAEWDGLNYLMVSSSVLSVQGKRKVLGFCAAGGEIIKMGKEMDFPQEISLEDVIKQF